MGLKSKLWRLGCRCATQLLAADLQSVSDLFKKNLFKPLAAAMAAAASGANVMAP